MLLFSLGWVETVALETKTCILCIRYSTFLLRNMDVVMESGLDLLEFIKLCAMKRGEYSNNVIADHHLLLQVFHSCS